MHFLLDILAKPLRIIYIFAVLFLIHPVIADEKKIETVDLDSVKKIGQMKQITMNTCSEVQEVSAKKIYHHQIAIAMDVIIMVPINHLGENS